MTVRTVGIVLAGGASRRMGTAKAALLLDGRTFLAHAVTALEHGGVDALIVVAGAAPEIVTSALPETSCVVDVVQNPAPVRGQLSSLKVALEHACATWPGAGAAVVSLVDHPAVQPSTVAALIAATREPAAPAIVVPAHGGRRGHPVLFARAVWPELLATADELGARVVVRADPGRVRVLAVDDPGILVDVDTPEDLERLLDPPGRGG